MGQLSQVAGVTRQIIKYGALGIVAYIILTSFLKFTVQLWKKLHPPAPPPPTVAFGKLQAIVFPSSVSDRKFSYRLETPNGMLPKVGDRATVYALPPKTANLLALDHAKTLAKKLGFAEEPQQISADTYRFSKALPALLTLDFNLVYDTFTMKYQWPNDETILTQKQFSSEAVLIKQTQQILKEIGLLAPDLETGQTSVSFLRASANAFIPALSLSEADFVKVDYFRASPEQNTPVVTPIPPNGNITFIFSGSDAKGKQIVLFKYHYFPVDFNSQATYPLKPVATAWDQVQNGQAYVAAVSSKAADTIVIRRIYLGLYDSDQFQPYLQPVYVFQGDEDFVAYVPAVNSQWIKN